MVPLLGGGLAKGLGVRVPGFRGSGLGLRGFGGGLGGVLVWYMGLKSILANSNNFS